MALIFWAQRMLHLGQSGKYADVMEQAQFNGALTGLSRDGQQHLWFNTLESDGRHSRWVASVPLLHHELLAPGGVRPQLLSFARCDRLPSYGGISATVRLADGQVALREVRAYPWSGDIRIESIRKRPSRST